MVPVRLLSPSNRPHGPERVTVGLRPQRLAFLVDPLDPAIALAAVEAACLTWGGIYQFLIPCPIGGRPDSAWMRVLAAHDPDELVDLVGVDANFVEEQACRWGRHTTRWERPTQTMELVGATAYAALRRWTRLRPQGHAYLVATPEPLAGHPLALPLAFRLGRLAKRPMDRWRVLEDAYNAADHADFVTVCPFDPFALDEPTLIGLAVRRFDLASVCPPAGSGVAHHPTLPELTSVLLPAREPSLYDDGAPHPEHAQSREAFYRRVVVVGDPGSVPDLCLAWNLRAQRDRNWHFPVWVGPDWLPRDDIVSLFHWGRTHVQPGLSERRETKAVHLVSASLDAAALVKAADGLGNVVSHADFARFFDGGFRVGIERTTVVDFDDGVAYPNVPDYGELGDWAHPERIGWTAAVEGYVVPAGSTKHFGHPPAGVMSVRTSPAGMAGMFSVPDTKPAELWPLGYHDAWEILVGLAARAGYEAAVSDKGRRALALFRLVGGGPGLRVLASSRVYKLLRAMAEVVTRQAVQQEVRRRLPNRGGEGVDDYVISEVVRHLTDRSQFDRQHWNWDSVKHELGEGVTRELCDELLRWMVERRVVFQGYEFACPTCGLRRWHPIGRLAETQVCDGCQTASASPTSTNVLKWSYRLNEAVAQAVDLGVLPHLLAANRALDWALDRRAALLGILPGVLLTPLEPCGPPQIEVDMFAVKGGRVVVGECKAGGDRITEQTVDRFAALGTLLDCSRIVFATAADFSTDASAMERARSAGGEAAVELWEAPLLFDSWELRFGATDPATYLSEALRAGRESGQDGW